MPADELDGKDLRLNDSKRPKVEASFTHESYGPGSRARLTASVRAAIVNGFCRNAAACATPCAGIPLAE